MWFIKCRGGGKLCQIIAGGLSAVSRFAANGSGLPGLGCGSEDPRYERRMPARVGLAMGGDGDYSWASSNSFIQARALRSSRGLVPSGGPTMPSFSIRSMRRAARP